MVDGDRCTLSNHGVESKGCHRGNTHALRPSPGIKHFGRNDPRQWTAGTGEAEVPDPGNDDEAPLSCLVVGNARREHCKQDCRNDEREAVAKVSQDQRPAATCVIDEEDAQKLRN